MTTKVAGMKEARYPKARPRVIPAAGPLLLMLARNCTGKKSLWVANYPKKERARRAMLPTRAQR